MVSDPPTIVEQLEQLEHQRNMLCAIRAERVAAAELTIKHANAEFDRDALSLGRKINKLRASLDTDTSTVKRQTPRKLDTGSHDPEWSQEDIDHYYELRGGNGRK